MRNQSLQDVSVQQGILLSECITRALYRCQGLFYRMARCYGVEVEDLQQEAAYAVERARSQLEHYEQVSEALLYTIVKHRLLDCTRKLRIKPLSLDVSYTEDGATLGEIIPDESSDIDVSLTQALTKSEVHAALHRLPLDEQYYLARRFELAIDLDPQGGIPHRTRPQSTVRHAAYRHLKMDARLQEVVGQEVLA